MRVGDKVFHSRLGKGSISEIAPMGADVWVWVDFGYTVSAVRAEDLQTFPEGAPLQPAAPPQPASIEIQLESQIQFPDVDHQKDTIAPQLPSPPDRENIEARRGITALRLGQVLESQILDLSVGTEQMEATFREVLDRAAVQEEPNFLLIEGAWGGGKTHALTLLQAMARGSGLVTANVVMDGHSVSLFEPMQLMAAITSSLQFPGHSAPEGVSFLLSNAVRKWRISDLRNRGAYLIANVLDSLSREAMDDPDVQHILDDYFSLAISATQATKNLTLLGYYSVRLPTIRAHRLSESPKALRILLTNWAHFAKVTGSKGLLVVLDELDVEYAATSYWDRTSERRRNRRHEVLSELRELEGTRAPIIIAFASAPGPPEILNEHDAVENIRSIFQGILSHIIVPTPDSDQLRQLYQRIVMLYREAYPTNLPDLGERQMHRIFDAILFRHERSPGAVPRQFVRRALEALDVTLLGNDDALEKVIHALRSE